MRTPRVDGIDADEERAVDLENAVSWIPDLRAAGGIVEVRFTDPALEAFREKNRISRAGTWWFRCDENPTGRQRTLETG